MADRRQFLNVLGFTAGVALVPGVLRSVAAAHTEGSVVVKLEEHAELKEIGGAIVLDVPEIADAGGKIILARTGDASYVALSAKCSHKGCTIGFDGDNKRFECPCHGSQYNLDGTVAHGPAPRAMNVYPVTVAAGGIVTISLAPQAVGDEKNNSH